MRRLWGLKKFRSLKGIRQTDLTKAMGMSEGHLSLIENGKIALTARSMRRMVEGYKKLGEETTIEEIRCALEMK